MRQRRRQAASLGVLLAFGGIVAAHHGGPAAGHQGGHGAVVSAGHAEHERPVPAAELDIALAVCLAVLPFLAVVGLAALGAPVRGWGLRIVRAPARPLVPSLPPPARRPRAGPRLLCVMRC